MKIIEEEINRLTELDGVVSIFPDETTPCNSLGIILVFIPTTMNMGIRQIKKPIRDQFGGYVCRETPNAV